MITAKHVTYRYEDRETDALTDVSFQINKGEWISIVGHNGSGKSTLVKLLGGIMPMQQGTITIDHLVVDESNQYEIHSKVGMVFQNPDNQFVGSTVEDDVAFSLENHGVEYDVMHQRVFDVLQAVGMDHMMTHEPHHLSGGQKQRVAIAGVIALRPDVIILDEATAMLDPEGREEILKVVRELQQALNLTVIAITHDLEETMYADRLFVFNEGRMVMCGAPDDVFSHGRQLIEMGLDLPFAMKVYHELYHEMKFIRDEELLSFL